MGRSWRSEVVVGQLRCCLYWRFLRYIERSQRLCVPVVPCSSRFRVSDTFHAMRLGGDCNFQDRPPVGLYEIVILPVPSHPLPLSASSAPPALPLLLLSSP